MAEFAILYDVIVENKTNLHSYLKNTIEKALNANPSMDFENATDTLLHIERLAEEFSNKEYNLFIEKGFDEYIQFVKPYIHCYLSKEDLDKIELLEKWELKNASEKETIKNIYRFAFIRFKFKLIIVDKDLFNNYNSSTAPNRNIQIWEDFLKKIEFDNINEYKRLYYFYKKEICGLDYKVLINDAPPKIQYKETRVKFFVKEGLDIAKKYNLPLPNFLK